MKNKIYARFEQDFADSEEITLLYNYEKLLKETGYSGGMFLHLMKKINSNRSHKYTILARRDENTIEVTRKISSLDGLNEKLLLGLGFVEGYGTAQVVSNHQLVDKIYDWKHETLPICLFLGKKNWFYDSRNHKWVHPDQISKAIYLLQNTTDEQVLPPMPIPTSLPQQTLYVSSSYPKDILDGLMQKVEGTNIVIEVIKDFKGQELDKLSTVEFDGVKTYAVITKLGHFLAPFREGKIHKFLTQIIDAERFNDSPLESTSEVLQEEMELINKGIECLKENGLANIEHDGGHFTASIGYRLRDAINWELMQKQIK